MTTLVSRSLALLLIAASALSCKSESSAPPEPEAAGAAPAAAAAEWPDARVKEVATFERDGRKSVLTLKHSPAAGAEKAKVELVLAGTEGERTLWSGPVSPAQRDALWAAAWKLAIEPDEGGRLAVSSDGGATWRTAWDAGAHFCPHARTPGKDGEPDWPNMPSRTQWAAEVLATSVWGCAGEVCKSGSRASLPVHYTVGSDDLLPSAQLEELRLAIAHVESAGIADRRLAMAVFGAALTYQHGLERSEIEKLAALAVKAIAEDGPLSAEERRTLKLQLMLAKSETKKLPPHQLSPRLSIEIVAAAVAAGQPEPVGATTR
ncbi:MAG: hypothetical protein ACOX6T_15765 [Myxococcales bacterium]|jgi:hypothetical protein